MKRLALIAAAMIAAAPAFAADPAEGLWRTKPDDNGNFGLVQVAPCGQKLCGTLVRAYNGQGQQIASPNVGRQIVWDMVPQGNGRYGEGRVYAPDRDKTYRSKMELKGNVLSVSGCVMGGAICRASDWTRER